MKKRNTKTSQKFRSVISEYEKLGLNISQALGLLLKEHKISYLSITYRVKDHDSFMEKIERKNYNNPFEQIEDICGVRIICYYQSDIEKIKEIVKKEFDVTENEKKEEKLEYDQFGYRSSHFILKIRSEWLNTPNYRGLEDLKAELQVRTVLMHAWAEIEHKLAYKSESQIPKEFRRKLSRISAKLEESDEQFEKIKNQIKINNDELIKSAQVANQFIYSEFNLDSLQAFLDYGFSDRKKVLSHTRELFSEMLSSKIDFKVLVEGYEKAKDLVSKVEKDEIEDFYKDEYRPNEKVWSQVGAARTVLELVSDKYYAERKEWLPSIYIIDKYRNLIK